MTGLDLIFFDRRGACLTEPNNMSALKTTSGFLPGAKVLREE